ncbi:MAG: hypothetical protein KAV83_09435, partial [Desulfobacterales bacterium]|nr:hypothetical protein [Desulfobacterales bacterium]
MLSSVLNSPPAIKVNIAIMRAFVKLRHVLSIHKDLAAKLSELERKIEKHDESIEAIFEAIRQLMTPPETDRRKIGFDIKEGHDERILGDSEFVEAVLSRANEKYDRHYELKRRGYDLDRIA